MLFISLVIAILVVCSVNAFKLSNSPRGLNLRMSFEESVWFPDTKTTNTISLDALK